MARPINDPSAAEWPENGLDRLDLETYLAYGVVGGTDLTFVGWPPTRCEAIWRARGGELEPGPDWWAWQEWGRPGACG